MGLGVGAAIGLAGAKSAMGLMQGAAGGYIANKTQYNFKKKEALNRPSWEVQGLKKAGLNPILAATGGWQNSSTAGTASAPNSQGPDIAENLFKINSAKTAKATAEKTRHEAEVQKELAEQAKIKTKQEQMKFRHWQSPAGEHLSNQGANKDAGYNISNPVDALFTTGYNNLYNLVDTAKRLLKEKSSSVINYGKTSAKSVGEALQDSKGKAHRAANWWWENSKWAFKKRRKKTSNKK